VLGLVLALLFVLRSGELLSAVWGLIAGYGLGVALASAIRHERVKKQPKPKIRARRHLPPRRSDEGTMTRPWRWWEMQSKVGQGVVSMVLGALWIGLVFAVVSGGKPMAFIGGIPFGAIIGLAMYIGGRRGSFV
jgi:hypothetical protein